MYLLIIHSTSQYTTFLKKQLTLYPQLRHANPEKHTTCFGACLYFAGRSTREPASTVCNNEQGDLLHSEGPHRNRS